MRRARAPPVARSSVRSRQTRDWRDAPSVVSGGSRGIGRTAEEAAFQASPREEDFFAVRVSDEGETRIHQARGLQETPDKLLDFQGAAGRIKCSGRPAPVPLI